MPYSSREILHKFNSVPFFFSNPVTTIDQMSGFITYHPTDMYICEELGFFLDNVSNLLHSNNIKIRIYPNVCQSSFPETNSLKTFFVRPDDIRTYKKYVDIFEIFVSPIDERQAQRTRQQIIFKAYKNEEWYGEISEIIPSFNGKLDSRYVISSFGTIRPHCHKRCIYNPNVCKVCDNCAGVADALKKHLLTVRRLQKLKSVEIP